MVLKKKRSLKLSAKARTLSPISKVKHFSEFAPPKASLPKKFNAVVGFDKQKRPAWFLFDSYAFWEFCCRIDEKLFDTLADKEYDSNMVGKLVDELETNWPFTEEHREEAKREYEGALKDISKSKIHSL